jgi:hypothetical protein
MKTDESIQIESTDQLSLKMERSFGILEDYGYEIEVDENFDSKELGEAIQHIVEHDALLSESERAELVEFIPALIGAAAAYGAYKAYKNRAKIAGTAGKVAGVAKRAVDFAKHPVAHTVEPMKAAFAKGKAQTYYRGDQQKAKVAQADAKVKRWQKYSENPGAYDAVAKRMKSQQAAKAAKARPCPGSDGYPEHPQLQDLEAHFVYDGKEVDSLSGSPGDLKEHHRAPGKAGGGSSTCTEDGPLGSCHCRRDEARCFEEHRLQPGRCTHRQGHCRKAREGPCGGTADPEACCKGQGAKEDRDGCLYGSCGHGQEVAHG